ncbi:MAG: hypothetical protein ACTFAL_15795 [Candidatus Electronema sp. V4]|uniref:hypothetical protein n=1 Tax=Candidatus Electronema sp. V4 TaxID=3454756 RepID=UPI00405586C8
MNPHFMAHLSSLSSSGLKIEIQTDADEFLSCVGNKKNQRWTWHAGERKNGMNESCCRLIDKFSVFPMNLSQ